MKNIRLVAMIILLLNTGSSWCADENGDLEDGRGRRLDLVQRPGIPLAVREPRLRRAATRCYDECVDALGPCNDYRMTCIMGLCTGVVGGFAIAVASINKSSDKQC